METTTVEIKKKRKRAAALVKAIMTKPMSPHDFRSDPVRSDVE
jgi:hypothetical protein